MRGREKPKATILVIDDEPIVHESARRILEEEGYAVDGALRVDEAVQKLANRSYDVVLTDLMMPGRSGIEAIQIIAKDHPDTGVVVFTGFATVDSAVQSMKLGALDYLPKPFTPDELCEAIERAAHKVAVARREREIERLYSEAERALSSSLDLKQVLNLICSSVVRLFNVKGAALLMYRKRDKTLEYAASCGLSAQYVNKGVLETSRSIPGTFQWASPLIVEEKDFDTVLQFPAEARKEKISSILSVPLRLNDTIIGFLRVYSSEKHSFEKGEMSLLIKCAELGARAIENAMVCERVRNDIEEMKKYFPAAVAEKVES